MDITCCSELIIEKEDSQWKGHGYKNPYIHLEMWIEH